VTRELSWREALAAAATSVVLAVAMTWPLVLHMGSEIGKDIGDPLLETWQVAWIGHALLRAPGDLWQANTFWPYDDTLAFSDALVGYAPVALFAQASPHTALLGYNLLFLFAYALAFLGAYLLARELGIGWLGAAAAGAAFAYAPWKLSQNGHLHVLSSGGVPLALFLLIRGYRRRSPATVLCGWLVAAWQMTLGFTLGLQLAYLLAVLAAVALVAILRRSLPRPDRRTFAATAVGLSVFVVAVIFMSRPYLRVVDAHPEARKSVATVVDFSPPRTSFLAAPVESWLWADATRRVREKFGAYDEMVLFPGLAISLLAVLGALGSVLSLRLRIGLVVGVITCALLSLGLRADTELTPYRLLFDFAPGWDGVRTPSRINALTSLGLAVLAGAGVCVLVRIARARQAVVATALGLLLVAAILTEGLGPLDHPRVPPPPVAVRLEAAPQFHLPAGFFDDPLYSYWSTAGFPKTVNGAGGFDPNPYDRLRETVSNFPDTRSVEVLRALGVRSVLFHPEQAQGTSWEGAENRPIVGLPLTRQTVDGVVVYRLR
jgi:hypothetical protein